MEMETDVAEKPYNKVEAFKKMLSHKEASKILYPDKEFDDLDKESNKKVKAIYKIVRNEIVAQKKDYAEIETFSRARFGELKSLIPMNVSDIVTTYNLSPVKSPVRKAQRKQRNAQSTPAPHAIREEGKSASSEHESRERLVSKK